MFSEEDAKGTIQQMIQFIEQEAKERAKDIMEKARQEYQIGTFIPWHIESEKLISAAKEKIRNEYKDKMEKYSIQKRM